MAKYTGQMLRSVTSTTLAVGTIEIGATARRVKLLEVIVGSDAATLGTSNFRWDFQRSTTASTAGSSLGAAAVDPADVASNFSYKTGVTANGTLTSGQVMLTIPMSQQTTVRWVAPPGGEIVIPATTNNGMHFLTPVCGNTPSAVCQFYAEEQ